MGGNDCASGSCPVVGNDTKSKLVKANELPLHGNPYPPKDVIQDDSPSSLELTVGSIRTTVQPFLAPFCAAYQKSSDVLAIGAAHTQSAVMNLVENRGTVKNGMIIGGASLFGVLVLGRRRGILKRFMWGSLLGGSAAAVCYPREVKEKSELAFFIAKNRLPSLVQDQFRNLTSSKISTPDEPTSQPEKAKSD